MSLRDAFETRTSQVIDGQLVTLRPTYPEIVKHIRETYIEQPEQSNPHKRRRNRIEERLRYYRDEYEEDVKSLVDLIFQAKQVRDQRKRIAQLAMSMNVTKNIIDSISTLYDKPAERSFGGEGVDRLNEQLLAFEEEEELDEFMPELHRLTQLCNQILVWEEPTLRAITPDEFDAIEDQRDPLQPAGYLIDWVRRDIKSNVEPKRLPHFKLWDDEVKITLDGRGMMIGEPEKHGLGRLPGMLVHRSKPVSGGKLLDAESGTNIIAAHKAVVLISLMIIRLAKSQGENQPVLSGDLARVASGQPMDGETPIGLPPGVDVEMLQMKTDPDHLLKVKRDIIASVASDYGLSYEQVVERKTTDSSRQKLIEIRRRQAKRWRRVEKQLVRLRGIDAEGYHVAFAELAVKEDASDEHDLFEKRMRQGLDNHLDYLKRQDPDLTDEMAWAKFLLNLQVSSRAIEHLRALNIPRDAEVGNAGRSPQENGRMGGRPNEQMRALARRALMEAV